MFGNLALEERHPHGPAYTGGKFFVFVQRLASDAVDQVRRRPVRDEDDAERQRAIKGSRFALLRSEWNLTVEDRAKISEIQRSNRPLYRVYLLKQALAHLLGYQQAGRAVERIKQSNAYGGARVI